LTWLDLTWLDLTWLDLTWLDSVSQLHTSSVKGMRYMVIDKCKKHQLGDELGSTLELNNGEMVTGIELVDFKTRANYLIRVRTSSSVVGLVKFSTKYLSESPAGASDSICSSDDDN
jgi:hypothetical protein